VSVTPHDLKRLRTLIDNAHHELATALEAIYVQASRFRGLCRECQFYDPDKGGCTLVASPHGDRSTPDDETCSFFEPE